MSTSVETNDLDRRIRDWLDDGPEYAPRDLAAAVVAPVGSMRRRRRGWWSRWSWSAGPIVPRLVVAVLVIALLVGTALVLQPLPDTGAPNDRDRSTLDFGDGGPGHVGIAGIYRSAIFQPTVRFEVPEGWGVGQLDPVLDGWSETALGLPLTDGLGAVVITRPTTVDAPGPGLAQVAAPPDLLGWLRADPDLALGEPSAVRVGGLDGWAIEGTVRPEADIGTDDGILRLTRSVPLRPRHHVRLVGLEVRGETVLIASIAPADRFEAFRARADALIDSLGFPTDR